MMLLAAAGAGAWSFTTVGLPVLVVLPMAAAAFWAIGRLSARELAVHPPRVRRTLSAVRSSTAGLLALLMLEPTCTFRGTETELPTIAVLMDTSGSMSVKDAGMSAHHRLNEAVALSLVPSRLRDTTPSEVAEAIESVIADAPQLASALTEAGEDGGNGRAGRMRTEARDIAEGHAAELRRLAPGVAGLAAVSTGLAQTRVLLEDVARALGEDDKKRAPLGSGSGLLVEDLRQLQQSGREVARRCRQAQRFADAALVAAADEGSPISKGLAELAKLTRFERAKRVVADTIMPFAEGRARLRLLALERGLEPLDSVFAAKASSAALMGPTDFEAPLAALAGSASGERLAGVLILSDGRQTSGGDPIGAARAIAARGTKLGTILVGDPGSPRDAVVSEIIGSRDVFLGETIRLDVRFRISGFRDEPWELTLSRPNETIDERTVRGTGKWQQERFEFTADKAGIEQITATLRRVGGDAGGTGHGILREYWTGIGGSAVKDLTGSARFNEAPDGAEVVGAFEGPSDWADGYGSRLRGYVVPPLTGSYTFWIASDDGSELWLSSDSTRGKKALVCKVDGYTSPREWQKYASQKSGPIQLRAGEKYYVEALQKEGSSLDNIAVGWQLPDSTLERPIPGERLLPFREGEEETPAAEVLAEASLDNNHAQIIVAVSEDPLRVLLVDSMPRWESRYIVTMLERDRRVEISRRYRSVALPAGQLEMLPATQEELDGFDVLVLGDLRPEELSAEAQTAVANFVSRRGGFLIVLAGPRGMPAQYNLGGIADVLPVRSVPESAPREGVAATIPPRVGLVLGDAAAGTTIVDILDDVGLNKRLWPALPPLNYVARNVAAKTGADVLLKTNDALQTPVAVIGRHGAGRVLYMGTDETWRWRDRLGDRVHQTFWLQALRWGLGERLRGGDPRLQVSLDRALISPGESAELRARLRLLDGTPVMRSPRVRISRIDERGGPAESPAEASTTASTSAREMEMVRVVDSDDTWRVPVQKLEEGRWRVTVTPDHPALSGVSEQREIVVRGAQGAEAIELRADRAALTRISKAGGFRTGDLIEAGSIVGDLIEGAESRVSTRVMTYSLWDGYGALVLVVGLLGVEWVWRKRLGMP
jgi:uncharacterized membrane protein